MKVWPALTAILLAAFPLASCAMREIPISQLRLEYGLPASRTFEPSPGVRVHYTDEGKRDARTLILVHGFAASAHAWRPWIDRLAEDYRLVAIDLPGHGLTQTPAGYRATLEGNADLVEAIAAHLGIDRFVLAGNSMGGTVSLAYAMEHSRRLQGLVLVSPAGWPVANGGGPPGAFALLNNEAGRFVLKLLDPRIVVGGGLKSAYVDEALVTDAVIDRYAELAMGEGHRDVLLTQNSQPAQPWTRASFAAIRTPTLVMVGEKDALIPPASGRAIARAIPDAYLVTYPEGGHLPMEQLPDETVAHLRAFMVGLPAKPSVQ
jgi:pimeloyl-ACP methyl ester carboxylesterase